MSPNLSSAAHNHNKLMYEKVSIPVFVRRSLQMAGGFFRLKFCSLIQVIFNLFTLTGVSHFTRTRRKHRCDERINIAESLRIRIG